MRTIRKKRYVITCANPACGQLVTVDRADQQYCSPRCFQQHAREMRTGSDYREWKKAVIARDGVCRMCGCTNETRKLIAHHIVPLSDCPEAKLLPANGMTLCVLCHDVIHGTQGNSVFRGVFGNRIGRKIKLDSKSAEGG